MCRAYPNVLYATCKLAVWKCKLKHLAAPKTDTVIQSVFHIGSKF